MTAQQRLDRLLRRISEEGKASESDCLILFATARELMEERGDRHLHLKLYADWLAHTKLDRRPAREVLQRVNDLRQREQSGEHMDYVTEVSRILSIASLRAELQQLLMDAGLPTFIVDSQCNWRGVMRKVLTALLDKPILGSEFTEDEQSTGWGSTGRVLRLTAEGPQDADIYWEVELGPCLSFRGLLRDEETREDFLKD